MNVKYIFGFLLSVSMLSGCTTAGPTYHYLSTSKKDPVIRFDSNFNTHTFFSVNTNNENPQSCKHFETVGFILKVDSVFIYDKPSLDVSIKTKPNKAITVKSLHSFNDSTVSSHCGPLYQTFTPESGMEYIVMMEKKGSNCRLSVNQRSQSNSWQPTKTTPSKKCL